MNTQFRKSKHITSILLFNIVSFSLGHLYSSEKKVDDVNSYKSVPGKKNIQLTVKNFFPPGTNNIKTANIFDKSNNLIFSRVSVISIAPSTTNGLYQAVISVKEKQLSNFNRLNQEYFHLLPSVRINKFIIKKGANINEIKI